jgi:hypothetical protein
MFDSSMAAKIQGAFANAFGLLSTPAVWTQTKAPHATKSLEVGIKTAGPKDEAIINAYGVNAKIITMAAKDFTDPPEQFDQLVIGGEVLVLADVHPSNIGNTVVFWKGYVRGKRV